MGTQYTFYDYVAAQGENGILRWLNSIGGRGKDGHKAKIAFTIILQHLEGTNTGEWKRPYCDMLHGPCSGLYEIRKEFKNIPYRLIGFHGPGQGTGTLVFGAREVAGEFEPSNTCQMAQRIKALVESDPSRYRREHDWS
jgi:hypothetical protein